MKRQVLRIEDWWVVIRLITAQSPSSGDDGYGTIVRQLTIDLTDQAPRLSTSWSMEDENVAADLYYQAHLRWTLVDLNRGDVAS